MHIRTAFTINEDLVDKAFRSPFFEDLEEINGVFVIKERKRRVNITRPYQCGIAVQQIAKLRMSELYYDFLDKYLEETLSSSRWTPTRCTWRFLVIRSTR